MPKPVFRNNDIVNLINENIKLLNQLDNSIEITFKNLDKVFLECDNEQLRVFKFNKKFNWKYSTKSENTSNFNKKLVLNYMQLINK